MAISLSTALSPNTTVRFNRLTNPTPTRILPNQSPHWRPRHWNKTLKLSPPRPSHVIASAVSESPPSVSEDTKNLLDTVKVYDVNGNAIPISDLWKDRKAVVAFARHFGWSYYYNSVTVSENSFVWFFCYLFVCLFVCFQMCALPQASWLSCRQEGNY